MGCCASSPYDANGNIGDICVYFPGFRVPKPIDFSLSLGDHLSESLVERLSDLRNRIVALVAQAASTSFRTKRRSSSQNGKASVLSDLLQALEDYLPVLLGLVKDHCHLQHKVEFVWINQEDTVEETALASAWYEMLSVLHLMGTVSLSQANWLLLPRPAIDGYQPKVHEGSRLSCVDLFLKAAGYFNCALQHVLPQFPNEIRQNLPLDLHEGALRALCYEALGQGVEIQLGLAIENAKATLAVKRRLACEMVKCWQQAQDNIVNLPLRNGWGEKHKLFVSWKYIEAKAAAYYYHGMIVNESNAEKSDEMCVAALQAADEYLKESKRNCEAFHSSVPLSRSPPLYGTVKYLSEKITREITSKVQISRQQMMIPPTLPDFDLALKPDEYELPSVDLCWCEDEQNRVKP